MKVGCVVSLVIFAAFVYGYYVWLGQTFEPGTKEVWIGAFVAGLVATGGIGALWNSYYAWRDGAVLSDALVDLPRRDGRRTAVAGTLEPLGQPLVAPLSGKPCVLYEFDIYREETRTKKGGGTETSKAVDFCGIGKAECIIRSTSTKLRLIGFPDLDPLPERHLIDPDDEQRARQYVQFTAWEDTSGLGIFRGARDMFGALVGNEDPLKKDWRMIAVKDCPWLAATPSGPATLEHEPRSPGEASGAQVPMDMEQDLPDDEFDGDIDDDGVDAEEANDDAGRAYEDGSSYSPHLTEKRIEPGKQVVVIGHYDEVQQGLVSSGAHLIKIYLDDVQSVARKLASAKWSYLFGGLLTLVIVNAAVWGAQQIYRQSDTAKEKWRGELERAIRDGDWAAIDVLQERGANVKELLNAGRQPILFTVRDEAMARKLIALGADVNATDENGTTPLMQAVRSKNPELVKVLIAAKADLDARNSNYHTTALMDAEGTSEECADLLRNAGAQDERVTAANGERIDESHGAFATVREYLAAVFAADPARLRELSTPQLGEHFAGVDFPTWQESRPTMPRLVSGFVRGDQATLTVTGLAPIGADRTWVYQLRRMGDQWLVSRERWAD